MKVIIIVDNGDDTYGGPEYKAEQFVKTFIPPDIELKYAAWFNEGDAVQWRKDTKPNLIHWTGLENKLDPDTTYNQEYTMLFREEEL